MSFFDQLARVTRFKLVHARWRRQRMEVLPGVVPVSLLLARTEDTVVGLTDVRGYRDGFVFLLRVRWGHVADPFEEVPWPFPGWGSPDPLDGEPFPDELLRFGVQFADGRKVTNTATILYVGMPHRGRVPGWWVGPVPQLLLLGVLIAQDPGRIDRRSGDRLIPTICIWRTPTPPRSAPPIPCRSGGAKLTMMVQSTLSLVIAILVLARAINILPV